MSSEEEKDTIVTDSEEYYIEGRHIHFSNGAINIIAELDYLDTEIQNDQEELEIKLFMSNSCNKIIEYLKTSRSDYKDRLKISNDIKEQAILKLIEAENTLVEKFIQLRQDSYNLINEDRYEMLSSCKKINLILKDLIF